MGRCNDFTISRFYCTQCANEGIPIARKIQREREPGHLKKLYCIYCNKETNHAEVKPFGKYDYKDFIAEYHYSNFDENGNRKIPWKQFIGKLKREGKY